MGFPSTPSNGQTAVVNGIRYTYDSAKTAWVRSAATTYNLYTASNIAPTSPSLGDQWYYIASDILFEYMSDGTSSYWVDISSLGQVGNVTNMSDTTLAGNVVVGLNNVYSIGAATGYVKNIYTNSITANAITVQGNILPSANVTYNLGSSTQRFKDLWLSGSTIYLGGASLSTDGANVTISNPQGGSFSVAGTSSGSANVTFGNIFGNYYFSNGAAFTSSSFGNTEVAAYIKSTNGLGAATDAIVLPVGTTGQRPTAANGMMRYNSSINGGSIEAYLGGTWVTIASSNYSVGFLIVAGGGGGGGRIGGGGGGGGVMVGGLAYPVTPGSSYAVVVGAGGTASGTGNGAYGGTGNPSSVYGFTALGGGGGAGTDGYVGQSGGSGGGGGRQTSAAGGSATQTSSGIAVGYGNAGGAASGSPDRSGGGGGAGGAGASGGTSGNGGIGLTNPIPGSTVGQNVGGTYYVSGGGGGSSYNGPSGGSGGSGGGGAGIATPGSTGSGGGNAGTANTGGGGGGGGYNGEPGYTGGAGGSGVVVIYYAATTQRATGGAVTSYTSGPTTYWIHTYTSTGTFTFIA